MPYMNHEAGRDCLLELDSILCSVGLPYFLMQGTALGAWRDGGFTPTERDIDLGFKIEDFAGRPFPTALSRLSVLVSGLLDRGFDVEQFVMPFTRVRTVVAFKAYRGHVVHADLVGMVPWTDRTGKRWRFTCPPVRDWLEKPYALVHEAEALEECRMTKVLWGRKFRVPADVERYLTCEYGPDWRTPRDDHVSRTRVYNFVETEGIPKDHLEQFS